MTFRIRTIVLYPLGGKQEPRSLRLHYRGLSVVTGDPGRGKSSLIDIIDYCLASSECRISGGRILEATSWFGLELELSDRRWFIARRAPGPGRQTSGEFYIAPLGGASEAEVPPYSEISQGGVNTEGAVEFLSDLLGIPRLSHLEGIGLPTYQIGVRQSARFLFQKQYELTNPTWLFHNQSTIETAEIRRVLPFLLGIVSVDDVFAAQRLASLRQSLRKLRERLAELEALVGGRDFSRVRGLVAEAVSVGLSVPETNIDSRNDAIEALRGTRISSDERPVEQFAEAADAAARKLADLLDEQSELRWKYAAARERASDIRAVAGARSGFRHEVEEQTHRLVALEIVPPAPSESAACPVCGQTLDSETPLGSRMRDELLKLRARLQEFSADSPQAMIAAVRAEIESETLRERLAEVAGQIAVIERARGRLEEARAPRDAQLAVLGRIGYFLESISEYDAAEGIRAQIAVLGAEVAELEERLSDETFQSRTEVAAGRLAADMQYFASGLDFEYRNASIRFDVRRATVLVDRRDSVLSLSDIGGGENVEVAHLLAHVALHRYFAYADAPVPRILVIDQPSQVYFPREDSYAAYAEGRRSGDAAKALALVQILADASEDADFQVLLTEHADFADEWYQAAKVEPAWVDGRGLVPDEWPSW